MARFIRVLRHSAGGGKVLLFNCFWSWYLRWKWYQTCKAVVRWYPEFGPYGFSTGEGLIG